MKIVRPILSAIMCSQNIHITLYQYTIEVINFKYENNYFIFLKYFYPIRRNWLLVTSNSYWRLSYILNCDLYFALLMLWKHLSYSAWITWGDIIWKWYILNNQYNILKTSLTIYFLLALTIYLLPVFAYVTKTLLPFARADKIVSENSGYYTKLYIYIIYNTTNNFKKTFYAYNFVIWIGMKITVMVFLYHRMISKDMILLMKVITNTYRH